MRYWAFSIIFLLLASPVLAGDWNRPDLQKNKRVHHNNSKHVRVEVDNSTFTLAKWGSLSVPAYMQLAFSQVSPDLFQTVGDTIVINVANLVARFYTVNEQTLEWEIVFASKPNKSSWIFPIVSENLVFYYQPALTQKEIDEGYYRPDSVVGSYAVYHSSKANNEYKTGKAFHIYRPKAWDSAGDTVWLDLSVDTLANTMTIAGDRAWFRNAIYPVTIDPTFGYTGEPATNSAVSTAIALIDDAQTYTASAGDVITKYWVWAYSDGGTGDIYMAAYTIDANDTVRTRLAEGVIIEDIPDGATKTWNSSAVVSQSMTGGTEYCVAIGGEVGTVVLGYDTDGNRSRGTHTDLPETWVTDNHAVYRYGLYVEYTTGEAGYGAQIIRIGGQ